MTCRKIVYDKVQRVDYDKIGFSVAMLEVYADYSCNHCIFQLRDMVAREDVNQGCIQDTTKGFCQSIEC